ncbi:hypothetical protein LARI1_G006300 [Lachnellula arida]|uniref:Heterokaryon incompatibility domain-containing protein n=1 Tax=Lachnellula arida TaxID=1316785 RepID=A0A8T9B9J3_9HELO|nr:hypothetical protein LARI1_G006300 [Lachnellula arida]
MEPPTLVPHSCKHCRKLVIDLRKRQDPPASRSRAPRLPQPSAIIEADDVVRFPFTLRDLVTARSDGCILCIWILSNIDEEIQRDPRLRAWTLYATTWHRSELGFGDGFNIQGLGSFGLRRGGKGNLDQLVFENSSLALLVHSDDPAAEFVRTRPINPDPASPEALKQARSWFLECQKSHKSCNETASVHMPTRLLEISGLGEEIRVRLYVPSLEQKEPYTALSYCRGGEQEVKTTKHNILNRLEGITWDTLPKTIQDAVRVTQQLGILFLWVDSLCIVQDDLSDMSREISQMPSIYGAATVTIAASRSTNVHNGFLQKRYPSIPDQVFRVPYRCPNGRLGSVVLLRSSQGNSRNVIEPLDRRAWALQERILSKRVLDYGLFQTRWTCQESTGFWMEERPEKYTDGWRPRPDDIPMRQGHFSHEASRPSLARKILSDQDLKAGSIISQQYLLASSSWYSTVSAYTHRFLTVPSDRQLAISGIAERYGRVFHDVYLCGIWKFDLHRGLLWRRKKQPGTIETRPEAYQGPSWSWTGTNGHVDYSYADISKHNEDAGGRHLKLISYHIDLADAAAPYGNVTSAQVTISGRIGQAKWMPELEFSDRYSHYKLRQPDVDGLAGPLLTDMGVDAWEREYDSNSLDSVPVTLLEVLQYSGTRSLFGASGLVLRKVGESRYIRVGFFRVLTEECIKINRGEQAGVRQGMPKTKNWFDSCKEEVITIV